MIHGIDTSFLVATELAVHSRQAASRKLLHRLDQAGDQLALAPQVLAELVHIVTDPRRCSAPLAMPTALQRDL
jgi:predicted nucleic acid-binding protein